MPEKGPAPAATCGAPPACPPGGFGHAATGRATGPLSRVHETPRLTATRRATGVDDRVDHGAACVDPPTVGLDERDYLLVGGGEPRCVGMSVAQPDTQGVRGNRQVVCMGEVERAAI